MNRPLYQLNRSLVLVVLAAALTGFWPPESGPVAQAKSGGVQDQELWTMTAEPECFIIASDRAGTTCRDATQAEASYFNERDPDLILHPMREVRTQDENGLTITLRGTGQLDNFQEAKAAFERAAAAWESLIASPITIIIDVDFGPQRFGVPFPEGVIGATGTQNLTNSIGYISLRPRLISGATNPAETDLYNALPNPGVVTDGGTTTAIVAAAANLRAIGEIGAFANPPSEPQFGPPPSIGFNSSFSFDFDPSNGIDADKIDFDAVATHEIGHALGFSSQVGVRELVAAPLAVSPLDLFRFRPGITRDFFTQAQRVLSSGGEQVFFAGGNSPALSTGRPNGTGGDGQQPSHWKADELSGTYLGIMDPTIGDGFRATITSNDLAAFDAIGYKVNAITDPPPPPGGNNPPVINSINGGLSGDTLSLSVNAGDIDGDLAQAELSLLDQSNNMLMLLDPIALADDPAIARTLNLTVNGMGQFPQALKVLVALVDRRTNRSGNSSLDFSMGDSGAPEVRTVSFDGISAMTIKGGIFANPLELEINGVVVTPPRIKVKGGGGKLKITGTQSELKLRSGANRVRVLMNGLRSNIFILSI